MQINDIVTGFKNTGKYVGEITSINDDTYTVRILAVLIHPKQGDLHNPNQADVPFFHERKALAYREQTNIPLKMVKPYNDEVPNYKQSLKEAVNKLQTTLEKDPDNQYNIRSLEALQSVKKEYELMYDIQFN